MIRKKREQGYALIMALIIAALVTALLIGFLDQVRIEQKVSQNDTDYSNAFYAAEAGLEKLNADLSKLFQQTTFPTTAQIAEIQTTDSQPQLTNITFLTYEIIGGQSTRLDGAITAAATTITVDSTTDWPDSGYFMIDAEEITYSGKTAMTFTGCGRGTGNSTAAVHADNATVSRSKVITISEGANAGLTAQVIPFDLDVVAKAGAGTEARLTRQVQVALIPVFQFGVFSDSDLSFFAGPQFNFGGRVHSNGNLFLAAGSGGTTLSQKVTTAAEVIRAELANGVLTSVNHTGNVYVLRTSGSCNPLPGACRALAVSEASVTGGPGSSANSNWPTISLSTYNGNILSQATGGKPLTLPFAGGDATPIEIIRRPPEDEDTTSLIGRSRLANQASLRVFISDSVADLPGGTGQPLNNTIDDVADHVLVEHYHFQDTPTFQPRFAEARPSDPDFVTAANANETTAAPLIDGYIKIERQNTDGTWDDVTLEILQLGISTNQADSILRFQQLRSDAVDVTDSLNGTDYIPINMYDTRESHWRDASYPSYLRKIGIMNLIELDVSNLRRWFTGAIGAAGTEAVSNNGYIFYFSDRRGNRDDSGNETGELGFEDVVNADDAQGDPNGSNPATEDPEQGEDFNGNSTLERYGANLPYNPWTLSTDLYTTQVPIPVAATQIDLAAGVTASSTALPVGSVTNITVPGYYRIDEEIVRCTAKSGTTLTCTRAQEGTTAAAHSAIQLQLTAAVTTTTQTDITIDNPAIVSAPGFYRIESEVVYCTSIAGNTMTCERGRAGTTAAAHSLNHTYLAGNETATDTTIAVIAGAGPATASLYRIENEIVSCTRSSNTLTCTRGAAGTVAAAHNQNATTLGAAVSTTTTTSITVASGANIVAVPGHYRIDSEVVRVTAKLGNVLTVVRGAMGTTAATHTAGAGVRPVVELLNVGHVNLWTSQKAAKNRVHYFRRALRLVNGANTSLVNNLPSPGFTVASENPVYIRGNYNAYTGSSGFSGPHSYSAVIADSVTLLSNNWNDNSSFQSPYTTGGRPRTETNYRLAIAAGKGINFPQPADATGTPDFGTDGGTHNFLRFLESGSSSIWYRGSIVSLFYYRQATGTYKCCSAVYGAPTRQFAFDTDFLVPSQLPPGTPRFRDINNLAFRQTIRADTNQ
ncbi:MAG: pilus assembly PilX N-terminal domain-containing protein [Acidobacteria bacterium]|nr:pilus assembly PilX N-terminal domain-containing protein [Acidobacteriota bacterium]